MAGCGHERKNIDYGKGMFVKLSSLDDTGFAKVPGVPVGIALMSKLHTNSARGVNTLLNQAVCV